MILSVVLTAILVVEWCFKWINNGLPTYIPTQNFWLVDIFYRLLRIVAPCLLLHSLAIVSFHRPTIIVGAVLYLTAYGIKRLTRHLAYEDYL